MAIQELSKEEIEVVSGGLLIDLAKPVTSLLGLVLNPVITLLGAVGTVLDGLLGSLLGGLLSGLIGK